MVKIPKLSPVELFVGFCIQLPFYYFIDNWVFLSCVPSAFLWALGGAGTYLSIRRIGVSLISCLSLWAFYGHFWGIWIAFIPAVFVLSLGYGETAPIWRFFYGISKDRKYSDYVTRMMTYVLYWLVFGIALAIK